MKQAVKWTITSCTRMLLPQLLMWSLTTNDPGGGRFHRTATSAFTLSHLQNNTNLLYYNGNRHQGEPLCNRNTGSVNTNVTFLIKNYECF